MATKAYYQHHERTTDSALISDLQLRELGYSSESDYAVIKNNAGTARYIPTFSTKAIIESSGSIGIGRTPTTLLDIYHATNDVVVTLKTDKTDGLAYHVFTNDADSVSAGINAANEYVIANSANLSSPNLTFSITGSGTFSQNLTLSGHLNIADTKSIDMGDAAVILATSSTLSMSLSSMSSGIFKITTMGGDMLSVSDADNKITISNDTRDDGCDIYGDLQLYDDLIMGSGKSITMNQTVIHEASDVLTIDLACNGSFIILNENDRSVLTAGGGALDNFIVSNSTDEGGASVYGPLIATGVVTLGKAGSANGAIVTNDNMDFIIDHDDTSINDSFTWYYGSSATKLMELRQLDGELRLEGRLKQTGMFGEIHVHDASTAQTIATGATYTKVTAFTDNGQSSNCTPAAASGKITLTNGRYLVICSMSLWSANNSITYKGTVFLNTVEQDHIHWRRKISNQDDVGCMSMSGIISVGGSWELDVRMRHNAGSNQDVTIEYANLSAIYLGEQ